MLSIEQKQILEQSRDLSDWNEIAPGSIAAQARDIFLTLISKRPLAEHMDLVDHPFLTKWRSKKSKNFNNALTYAASSARDMAWISLLLDKGMFTSPNYIFSVFHRPQAQAFPAFKLFMDHIPWDLTSEQSPLSGHRLMEQAMRVGQWDSVQMLVDRGMCRRGDEDSLLFHSRILRSEKLLTPVPHAWALDYLWSQWGEPQASVLRSTFRAAFFKSKKNTSIQEGLDKIVQKWNPSHPDWKAEDSIDILRAALRNKNAHDFVITQLQAGWDIPSDHWTKAFSEGWTLHHSATAQALMAARDHIAIRAALPTTPSAPSRRHKI